MSLILHIESATDICSVCISDGADILSVREIGPSTDHAARITLMIEACCREAGITLPRLSAVSLSGGPGSYTSLRVGTATAKGICYALAKPLIVVDTLRSLALAAWREDPSGTLYCPMIDARRMEVYCALYDPAQSVLQPPAALVVESGSFDPWLAEGNRLVLSGNGAEKCKSVLQDPRIHFNPVRCSSRHLVPLAVEAFEKGQFADVAYFEPFYLKPPNVTRPRQRL